MPRKKWTTWFKEGCEIVVYINTRHDVEGRWFTCAAPYTGKKIEADSVEHLEVDLIGEMKKPLPADVLKPESIKVGKTYRGKVFREGGFTNNDRTVLWISKDRKVLQYDSGTVGLGRHYPKVSMEQFIRWAKHEVVEDVENKCEKECENGSVARPVAAQ